MSYLGVGALHEVSPERGGGTATLVVAVTVGRVRQHVGWVERAVSQGVGCCTENKICREKIWPLEKTVRCKNFFCIEMTVRFLQITILG